MLADDLFDAEVLSLSESPLRRPLATYRLQMHKDFRLDDAAAIVDYLADLGISDAYFSPYLDARPGSTHGYDVFDHSRINREIGDPAAHDRLLAKLHARGMGRVLDIVPNHMGVNGPNRFWLDVLELGPYSPSARFFDIDWHPVKEELEGHVLLPILEDQYGKVLEDGKFSIERDGGALFLRYHETRLPLTPRSYATIMERRSEELWTRFHADDEHVQEYRSIWSAAHQLPHRDSTDPVAVENRLRERDVIKRRLLRLCEDSPELGEFLDENIASFRGTPGDRRSFDALDKLLEQQVYRLAYWRVAADEINYRRFFDINDLAGLRTEDPAVFDVVHDLIFRWVDRGGVTALRIDHPDGLADPRGYFQRLQEVLFLHACRRRLERVAPGTEWRTVADRVRDRFREVIEKDPASPVARRFPVVAEKILSRGEDLPESWPIDGTVGYEYLNALNGMFVDTAASESIEATYAEFTADREPPVEVLYRAKELITRASLSSEVNMLARMADRDSEGDRRSRDFTLNEQRKALREVIACFPVYRTYLKPGEPASDRDVEYIKQAVARARKRGTHIDMTVFNHLQECLLLEYPEGAGAENRRRRDAFVARFQQTTGPVQAKGLEDTAFYRQVKLASLNEVGGDPFRFGNSPSFFHGHNSHRANRWPGTLSTTATHDTKRGEDTRIRIDALTELADEWKTRLARWSFRNARHKVEVNGAPAPDPREEYLFYQTLLGAWPFGGPDDASPEGLVPRLQEYMLKAAREAKVNTTWTDQDPSYSEALKQFVANVLEGPDPGPFLKDFLPFQRRLARIGIVHSLAQAVLKVASPGVPDVYQGCELWDFSLVDPDNRRPVDYPERARLLDGLRRDLASGTPRATLAARLLAAPEDGAIKLYTLWTALNHRKSDPSLYQDGAYRPIDADGEHKANVVAFARYREGRFVLAVAPRLVGSLMGEEARTNPIGRAAWGDTRLVLPDNAPVRRLRNLLTDTVSEVKDVDGHPSVDLAEVFDVLPIALLVADDAGGKG